MLSHHNVKKEKNAQSFYVQPNETQNANRRGNVVNHVNDKNVAILLIPDI